MRKIALIGRGLMALALLGSLLASFGGGAPVAARNGMAEAVAVSAVRDNAVLAVATDYGWSQSTVAYTEIISGTQVTTSCDDTSYNAQSLPFTFTFDGVDYTQFSINCNGFIAMGPTVTNSYTPISTGTSNNVIAALGGDQQTNAVDSEIRHETLGVAPDRVHVIQWKNFRHYNATGDLYNYQIRLYETSNVVEIAYGTFAQNTTNRTSEIGLRGATNTDFSNRTSTGDWTASTAGATNAATMALTSTYIPPSGLTWTWTPLDPHPILNTSYKTAPAQVVIGDPIAYSVHIINSGNAPAAAATLVDPIPTGTTYNSDVACSAGTCSYNAGLNQIEWTGAISVSAAVTVTFSVDTAGMDCGSVVVNEATLDDPDLFEDPVVKTASTSLASLAPTPLEGFEVSVPPAGWTETIVFDPGTDPDWSQESAGTYPTIVPHGGAYMAKFNSYNTGAGGSARLWTPALDLSAYGAPQIVFWMSHDTGYATNADRIQIQVSTDGVTWVDVGEPVLRYDATCTTACWKEHAVPLPAGYNINGVYIGFLGISGYGNNMYLDDTALSEGWYPCPYLSLTPDASEIACPGCSVEYALTLTNMTPDADTFDVAVSGNAWPTTLDPLQLALGAGASGAVAVTVEVPCDGGTDVVTITALGQTFGGTDAVTLTTSGAMAYWEQLATEPDNGRMDNVTGAWDGKVWSITGYGANLNVRSYDPAAGSWTVVGTPPPFTGNYARSGCQAGSKVYIYGDTSTTGFTGLWSYDMATTTWAQETPTGDAPPHTGIWSPAWAYDAETGVCYLTGGATVPGAGNLTTVYAYDTAANAWLAPLPEFTGVRAFHAAWVFTDNAARKLLCVAGGNNGVGMTSTQCYDFTAGAWGAEDADMGPLPASLWAMGYTQKVHEGVTQLWVIGGVRAETLTPVTSFFDVMAGVWADDGDLASTAVYRTSAVTLDNMIYHIGGSIGSFSYTGLADRHIQCAGCVLPPNIFVDPLSLNAAQLPGTVTQQTLTISNTGEADLTWQVLEEPLMVAQNVRRGGASRASALIAVTGIDDGALPVVLPVPQPDSPAAIAAEESGIDGAGVPVTPQRDPVARAAARRVLMSTGLLLVPDSTSDRIMALDPLTGNVIDPDFVPSNPVAGTGINAILSAGGNSILLSDQVGDVVHEFDLDGNYLGIFAPAGGADNAILNNVRGISLDGSGNLLVTTADATNADAVAMFDTSGNYLGNFVANGAGGMGSPFDVYGRASDWLVAGIDSDALHRYDLTGAYIADLTPISTFPEQIAGATNGNVLVANFSPSENEGVHEYTSDGVFVGRYDPVELGGYRGVYELPGGTILTTTGAGVYEIDRSGNLVETKITGVSGRFIEYVALPDAEMCTNPADVPWLSTDPISGTTPAGAMTALDVTFDSTGLAPGTYTANLCIESNDPDAGPGNETDLVVVPLELTVQAASIVLTKTVGTVPGVCATTDDITVLEGTEVYYCFEIRNTGDVTLTMHDLVDTELGTILTALPYDLAPGALSPQVIVPATLSMTTVNTATWTAYNANGPSVTATDVATVTVTPLAASIALTKTVGTVAGVCATTSDITVMEGTEVYYCYQIQNTGNITLTTHDLVDTELGAILTAFPYDLAPGASSPTVIVPATLSVTTVNTATWTAYIVGGPTATATDSARVVVEPSAVSVTGLRASASGGWSGIALLGAVAFGGFVWRRKRR